MMSVEKDLLLIPREYLTFSLYFFLFFPFIFLLFLPYWLFVWFLRWGLLAFSLNVSLVYCCFRFRARDYPAGVLCPVDLCRNSIDGTCSSNCSDAVCDEAVPQSKIFTYRYYKDVTYDNNRWRSRIIWIVVVKEYNHRNFKIIRKSFNLLHAFYFCCCFSLYFFLFFPFITIWKQIMISQCNNRCCHGAFYYYIYFINGTVITKKTKKQPKRKQKYTKETLSEKESSPHPTFYIDITSLWMSSFHTLIYIIARADVTYDDNRWRSRIIWIVNNKNKKHVTS
jgi:hypothetical protein